MNQVKQNATRTLLIAAGVSLGGFLFGFDAAIISGVIGSVKPLFNLDDLQTGWVVSSPSFSAMFAMLVAGVLSNRFGRKRVLILVAFLYALSAIASAYASSYEMLYIARMIGGLAFGAALVTAPMYIAEISTAANRGKLVSVQQLNIVLGFSAAYFCGYYLNLAGQGDTGIINADNAWRWMLGVEFLPAIIYFFVLFFIPASPRWLLLKNRNEEARANLEKLHGSAVAETEINNIKANIESGKSEEKNFSALFSPALRMVLVIGLILGVLQQITGINAIFFYATSIFEQTGIGSDAAYAQSVIVGIINVVFTILVMLLIDKVGRKPLLLIGIAGIAVSMLLTAYGFHEATYLLTPENLPALEGLDSDALKSMLGQSFENDLDFKNALKSALGAEAYLTHEAGLIKAAAVINPYLILVGILGFVASFAFSLGPVMWVMLSEMFPNRIRALAIGFIGFINSFVSWLVQYIFPWELSNFGNALTFFIYACLAAAGFFLFLKYLPETKGKSLEELERELVK